jgi:hypothetical protein
MTRATPNLPRAARRTQSALLGAALVGSLVIVGLAACAIDDEHKYGGPSVPQRANLPGPVGTDGGGGGDGAACEAGACAVSFTNNIWPKMSATGAWKCADGKCHGGNANSPSIDSPDQAYLSLQAYKIGGKPYVLPCTTDPTASTFVCNLQGTCGQKMPLADITVMPTPPTTQEITDLTTWVACGAPKN